MRECLGCARILTKPSQKLYCSVKCMQFERGRILIENWLATGDTYAASYQGHCVRDYIARDQHHRCAICRQPAEWNGNPLNFVLDHIDGDSTNNRRENLRLICPNCDSQLPTFKSRNIGRGRHSRRQRYAEGKSY
jgi:5-methylcytosine-specific restriction endonuclease McrA